MPDNNENKYEELKEVFTESMYAALRKFDDYQKGKKVSKYSDMISTSEAERIKGRARVRQLIKLGLLKQTTSGVAKNSVKYVSRKQLDKLDNVNI